MDAMPTEKKLLVSVNLIYSRQDSLGLVPKRESQQLNKLFFVTLKQLTKKHFGSLEMTTRWNFKLKFTLLNYTDFIFGKNIMKNETKKTFCEWRCRRNEISRQIFLDDKQIFQRKRRQSTGQEFLNSVSLRLHFKALTLDTTLTAKMLPESDTQLRHLGSKIVVQVSFQPFQSSWLKITLDIYVVITSVLIFAHIFFIFLDLQPFFCNNRHWNFDIFPWWKFAEMNQVLVKYLAIQTGGDTGGDAGDALVDEHFRPICVVLSS